MLDNNFLIKNPKLEQSQDYQLLRDLGIKHIENLSHKVWTDYNIHDPGITLLELLCYAITDLGYRTSFPIEDLLTYKGLDGEFVTASEFQFHSAREIFPSNPVTFNDFRKLIIDLDGIRNAWISKNKNVVYCLDRPNKLLVDCEENSTYETCSPLNGLFDILLEFEDNILIGRRMLHLGPLEREEGAILPSVIPNENTGISFFLYYPIHIDAVHVYLSDHDPNLSQEVTVHLWRKLDSDDFEEVLTETVTLEGGPKFRLPINMSIENRGEYLLSLSNSPFSFEYLENTAYPFAIPQVVRLLNGAVLDGSFIPTYDSNLYFLFDWEINFKVLTRTQYPPIPIPANSLGPDNPGIGVEYEFISPNGAGLTFDCHHPTLIKQIDLYFEQTGIFDLVLLGADESILLSETVEVEISDTSPKTVILDWSVPVGSNFQLIVRQEEPSTLTLMRFNAPGFETYRSNLLSIHGGIQTDGSTDPGSYYFFYNLQIEEDIIPVRPSVTSTEDLHFTIKELLAPVRNLCEDYMNLRNLKREEIAACLDIELRPDVDIEAVLAEIYYQLENYIAPPINFYTIEELLEKGKTTDQIFEGPLLTHGFIDDDEFRALQRRCYFYSSDIVQILMDIDGVIAVKDISLLSFIEVPDSAFGEDIVEIGGIKYQYQQEPWVLQLTDLNEYAPDFSPEKSKITFYKNGLPYLANTDEALELYNEKRAQNIQNRLKGHATDLEVPRGNYRVLGQYAPIQNDLPETYLVGKNPVPGSAPPIRKVQSRQLKAFLLFFEQFFTNYVAQLVNTKELFSWKKEDHITTYFTQELSDIFEIDALYQSNLIATNYGGNLLDALSDIIEDKALAEERKNRFLDHLMARFSESLVDYALLMTSILKDEAPARLITDKQALLDDYPKMSSERGKAFDYRFPDFTGTSENITGYQRRLYRLLGIYEEDCKVVSQCFSNERIEIRNDDDGFFFVLLDESLTTVLFTSTHCKGQVQICNLIDDIITFAALDLSDVTTPEEVPAPWIFNEGENRWELIRQCPNEPPDVLGYLSSDSFEDLKAVVAFFYKYAHLEGFHVIEHILLRKRTQEDPFMPIELHDDDDCECIEVRDPYSFRASIVLPSWPERFRNIRFRKYIEDLLRLEAPAHIYLKICWINFCEMQDFEACLKTWLEQHASLPEGFRGENKRPDYQLPSISELEETQQSQMEQYRIALGNLIDKMHSLTNVFPQARLHDCETNSGDEPQISLNNTSLGSL